MKESGDRVRRGRRNGHARVRTGVTEDALRDAGGDSRVRRLSRVELPFPRHPAGGVFPLRRNGGSVGRVVRAHAAAAAADAAVGANGGVRHPTERVAGEAVCGCAGRRGQQGADERLPAVFPADDASKENCACDESLPCLLESLVNVFNSNKQATLHNDTTPSDIPTRDSDYT